MIKCPSCDKAISEYAIVCPNCGADLKSKETIVKTDKAITIQKQDKKKKQTNFIINMAILLSAGLLTLFLQIFFMLGVVAYTFDILIYFLVVTYSVFNMIRYKLLMQKSKKDIFIMAAVGTIVFVVAVYLHKVINVAVYGSLILSRDINFYSVPINKWFLIVSVFFGLVWACFAIESICFIKDSKK